MSEELSAVLVNKKMLVDNKKFSGSQTSVVRNIQSRNIRAVFVFVYKLDEDKC